MRNDESVAFATMLTTVSAIYGREMTKDVIRVYWHALEAYDLAAVRQAFDRHVKNPDAGHFMPKPADLIRMIAGTSQDSALVAWAKVDKAVRSVGPYASVAFDDPIIHRVLADMGGWIPLGTKTDEEWPFIAREFENRYRGYRSRNEVPDYPRSLPGIAEHENKRQDGVALIGDAKRAQFVLEGGSAKPLVAVTRVSSFLGTFAPSLPLPEVRDAA